MKTAQTFLTQEEQDAIVACVQEAESRTSGEIVPMIASSSYEYPRASMVGGMLFGLVTAIGGSMLLEREDMWVFIPLFLGCYFLFSYLFEAIPVLKRPFISKHEMREEVEEAAFTAFYQHGLHHTRDLTGILIYISVYERSVQVLADKGINDKVDPKVWEEVVAMVTAGIKAGKPADAICQGVTRCAELVVEHFPIKHDDTDELPNLIINGE
ncbi:TPM domain-containing protein [Pseudodesulfovibrio sediminis]|uniref:TPM domain-containing protein n=1 Tax=Pseudodesulfovibrio sediminis TaxID=2810563 RepID=A0ABM7P7P5_9BACT|nr:TPM domain-containing protein [Pseudodesulfovibrio sediminis]BCS88961.1 hypothetical protein PSDVSF_22030 [Pseudodesulfovibrio sediminis]